MPTQVAQVLKSRSHLNDGHRASTLRYHVGGIVKTYLSHDGLNSRDLFFKVLEPRMVVESCRMSLGALCWQEGSRKSQGVFAGGCVVSCRHSPSNTTVSTGVFAHINTTPLRTNSQRRRACCSMPLTLPFLDRKEISWPASSTRMILYPVTPHWTIQGASRIFARTLGCDATVTGLRARGVLFSRKRRRCP